MWTKPNPRSYKLNIDAAFHDDGTGAVGVVLRNNSGEAIAGAAQPIYHVLDAGSTESLAMLKGFELLERLGCSGVTVESDCLDLVNACTGVIELFGPSSAILVEIFAEAQHIAGISFQHCKRDANLVAHNLAKHLYESKSFIF
uniref:RNase H type-1 domain-containing protein n=1 Tax=Triticum urartu TaxID=4572 RepID=A0A8R7TCJ5_TRIUA